TLLQTEAFCRCHVEHTRGTIRNMKPFFVLICSLALVSLASGARESKKETSHTKSSQHVATHTEHSTGGTITHTQRTLAPPHVASPGHSAPHVPSPEHPAPPAGQPPTAPTGNGSIKPAAPAPPPPVYHYNFPTKSGLIGRDFTRPLTPEEQSGIAREI